MAPYTGGRAALFLAKHAARSLNLRFSLCTLIRIFLAKSSYFVLTVPLVLLHSASLHICARTAPAAPLRTIARARKDQAMTYSTAPPFRR